jgi:hypothetical protein
MNQKFNQGLAAASEEWWQKYHVKNITDVS